MREILIVKVLIKCYNANVKSYLIIDFFSGGYYTIYDTSKDFVLKLITTMYLGIVIMTE